MTIQEAIEKTKRVKGLYAYESDYEALDMAISSLEAWGQLKEDIESLRRTIYSENRDYYTGYMCALSMVQGMMAAIEIGKGIEKGGSDNG